ncbi:hypothetical protein [Pedobacter nototheniae]|uniref:hypothetical protein n=1 Tax=Pedobacter nototheniae TaxID=2488994 RepID=UPI001B8D284A|nr:hypothetical protein [Pedobacter nototheniae]
MKNYLITALLAFMLINPSFAFTKVEKVNKIPLFTTNEYETSVTFPAGYAIGDYIEFVRVDPYSAGASGYYNISISYTRGNIAAAATHVAAISHANSSLWRETGRINDNQYVDRYRNFTIDCNGDYYGGTPRFRVRAVNTYGVSEPITVYIKVTSINFNGTFTPLSTTGNDLTVTKLQPMTNEWDLFVGNLYSTDGASIAIKVLSNGNVGIGTTTPKEKLSVNGNIRAKEVKVETKDWPDYVFKKDYPLLSLEATEKHIKEKGYLPGMPSAKEVELNGLELGEMNKRLLQKVEELTLHLIAEKRYSNQAINKLNAKLSEQNIRLKSLERKNKH